MSAASETYEFTIHVFENSQLEELLGFLKNFKKTTDRKNTAMVTGKISYLRTILRGE